MNTVALLGLNRFGEDIYCWLRDRDGTQVVGVFTEESQYSSVNQLEPDWLISAGFDHILPESVLDIPNKGAINLHPSYLPYNRGVNPDVWSIINDYPAGVTIHEMTPGVDVGPIVAQKQVTILPEDTARTLRERLDEKISELFKNTWPKLVEGKITNQVQDEDEGNQNYQSDFDNLKELDLKQEMTIGECLDLFRALTFPPYKNAYFEQDGEKYFVEVSITSESEQTQPNGANWDTPTLF